MLLTRRSKQLGYGVEIKAEGPNCETDGILCAHCGCYDEITPGRNPDDIGACCKSCDKLICIRCRGKGCTPLELRLEQWERFNTGRNYLRKDQLFDIFRSGGGRIL